MGEFFTELEEAELDARLIEVDEDGDLVVSIDDFRDQQEEDD